MYPYISKVNLWKLIQIYSVLYSGGGTFFLSDLQCALVRRRYIFLVRFTVCFSPEPDSGYRVLDLEACNSFQEQSDHGFESVIVAHNDPRAL